MRDARVGAVRVGRLRARGGRVRGGGLGRLCEQLGELRVLLRDLGERLGGRVPVEPDAGGALLQLLGVEQRGGPGRHVVEDALPALLLHLDALPAALDLRRGVGDGVGEDVRVPADELGLDVVGHAGEVAGAFFVEHEGEQHDLQQQVAELAVLRVQVAAGDGVGQLVDLLDGVADDVLRRLLAIPGTLHAQDVDDAFERDDLLAEQSIVERLAAGDGDERRSVIRSTGGGPPAQLARQLRPAGAGERDDDVAGRGAAHEVVEPLAVGGVELEQPAEAGVGGLGDKLPELAVEARRDEDGAAAGEGPQRSCGRQSGGGADVHEREAHSGFAPGVMTRLTSWPTATARRRVRPTRPGSARP